MRRRRRRFTAGSSRAPNAPSAAFGEKKERANYRHGRAKPMPVDARSLDAIDKLDGAGCASVCVRCFVW